MPHTHQSLLSDARITATLDALHARADDHDARVIPEVFERALERGASSDQEMADLLADAYMPINAAVGRLVHLLALTRPAGRVVEFGTSHGLSTIYLAAALDPDEAPVITTEAEPAKVAAALANFGAAGVDRRIDLRAGDAFESLASFDEPIGLLFLDGWKGLYLPLLQRLEHLLVPGALVIADDTTLLPDLCADYLEYVRGAIERFVSVAIPIDDGLEVSVVRS